jgi:hypothetical protein
LPSVSVRWIQRLCKDRMKLPSMKMTTKPLIKQRMRDQRPEFTRAYTYGGWTVEQWKAVMFLDESHFESQFRERSDHCRRHVKLDLFDPKFTKMSIKQLKKAMVWEHFSWKRHGGIELLPLDEMINGQHCLKLLNDKL